ncbi:MAG: FAD-dependent oxidoreductase [Burkholderiales bacterium]|nr:FAD-dependent oxidoreductase [Burkholderiales bacterium]
MPHAHYLIVGASHAALSALHAIRLHDAEGEVTLLTRDDSLPYSPTVLPYVVSGRSDPGRVFLRDESYFAQHKVNYLRGAKVHKVNAGASAVELADGSSIGFDKLLLATGAAPVLPPVPGLAGLRFHVLRTLADALALREALPRVKRAVVLGGGLIGMHAAENLAKGGVQVSVVEMQAHVLAGYFDAQASGMIEKVFTANGVRLLLGASVAGFTPRGEGCRATLEDGAEIDADLLLVATGVAPVTDFLCGSGIETERGVLVDEHMRTNIANIWAAGDVAQARGFFTRERVINGILPDAVDQGRIAGMAMAEDPGTKDYAGGVPLNTYSFFGQHAVSVGVHESALEQSGVEVKKHSDEAQNRYLKIVLKDRRLAGIFGVNAAFDPGIMWELILRAIDLGEEKLAFLRSPQDTARALMSKNWR